MSSDDERPPSQTDADDDGEDAGATDGPVAGAATGAGAAGEGPKGPSPYGSSARADDDLDAWMAAHFPQPQMSDEDDAVVEDPVAGTATRAGVAGEGPKGPSPFGSSALDDIFGETQFRDYDASSDPIDDGTAAPTVLGVSGGQASSGAQARSVPFAGDTSIDASEALTVVVARLRPRPERMSHTQVVLLWVGGALVAVLALVALFLVGTRVPDLLGPAPAVLASATPTPTPTPTEQPVGPVAAGEHAWDELRGGECVDPYTGPWAEKLIVVECASDHAAQLVTRGTFEGGGDPQALYPGPDALQAQINLLCTAPTVVDYPAAGKYSDVQFAASFAATPQEWAEGQHDYFCFVSRSSGAPITGTLAIPPAQKPSPSP